MGRIIRYYEFMRIVDDRKRLSLELKGVCYNAGGSILIRDMSLRIEAEPLTIVLGPNGAGKSLTLRLIHGLIKPDKGKIRWCSSIIPCAARDSYTRPVIFQAMVFQRPVILRRSVLGNALYGLRQHGVKRRVALARAHHALEGVGLAAQAHQSASTLSGGERQRLALARVWAMRPEVLFLDEPTANLDPASTRRVEDIVRLMGEEGTKIIMTTHDIDQARRLADEVVFLHQGTLLEKTPAKDFFTNPQTRAARAFLSGDFLQ
ncbi:MAG: ATP-binding cassette domain-containing protein [Parvularculales bacterium]